MPLQGPIESTSSTMYDIKEVIGKLNDLIQLAKSCTIRAQTESKQAMSRREYKEQEYQYGKSVAYTHMRIKLEDILKELGQ